MAARAAAEPDPWQAFELVFMEACVLSEHDLALFDLLARVSAPSADKGREVTGQVIGPLVERAQAAGRLRQDVSVEDVAAFMRMADGTAPMEAPLQGPAGAPRRPRRPLTGYVQTASGCWSSSMTARPPLCDETMTTSVTSGFA
ncbi:hypothetical protein ACFOWE_31795 [Planomonospora corallina]|uniref:Transcriptional regulator SbtR-like C-terminal domain-containing protein n=1 Tax=Planomonospora corallina TaxID=1806052 RepID=A0ABV8IFW0_9ACTN